MKFKPMTLAENVEIDRDQETERYALLSSHLLAWISSGCHQEREA